MPYRKLPKRNYIPTWQSSFWILNAKVWDYTHKTLKPPPQNTLARPYFLNASWWSTTERKGRQLPKQTAKERYFYPCTVSIWASPMDSISPPCWGLQAATSDLGSPHSRATPLQASDMGREVALWFVSLGVHLFQILELGGKRESSVRTPELWHFYSNFCKDSSYSMCCLTPQRKHKTAVYG